MYHENDTILSYVSMTYRTRVINCTANKSLVKSARKMRGHLTTPAKAAREKKKEELKEHFLGKSERKEQGEESPPRAVIVARNRFYERHL